MVDAAELLDIGVGSRLLVRELVAREAEDHETLRPELLMQLLQAVVLRSEAALARGVDDEQRLAGVVGERNRVAVVVDEVKRAEGIGCGHGGIVAHIRRDRSPIGIRWTG